MSELCCCWCCCCWWWWWEAKPLSLHTSHALCSDWSAPEHSGQHHTNTYPSTACALHFTRAFDSLVRCVRRQCRTSRMRSIVSIGRVCNIFMLRCDVTSSRCADDFQLANWANRRRESIQREKRWQSTNGMEPQTFSNMPVYNVCKLVPMRVCVCVCVLRIRVEVVLTAHTRDCYAARMYAALKVNARRVRDAGQSKRVDTGLVIT